MSAKKIGAGLCGLGILSFIAAVKMDSKSSFEDGTFIAQIAAVLLGAILLISGLAVAIFGD